MITLTKFNWDTLPGVLQHSYETSDWGLSSAPLGVRRVPWDLRSFLRGVRPGRTPNNSPFLPRTYLSGQDQWNDDGRIWV